MSQTPGPSPNVSYLAYHDARLVALGTQAEQHFRSHPSVTLFKLRQFGEVLANRAAAKVGVFVDREARHFDLINRLHDRDVIGATQRPLFHDLRRVGNAAVPTTSRRCTSSSNNKKFDPGPFVPPAKPKRDSVPPGKVAELKGELEELRKLAEARADEADEAEEEADGRMSTQELAAKADEERQVWEALAAEQAEAPGRPSDKQLKNLAQFEAQNHNLAAELAALQAAAEAAPAAQVNLAIAQAAEASEAIELTEAETRHLIDKQLRGADWEADSDHLRFEHEAANARRERGAKRAKEGRA